MPTKTTTKHRRNSGSSLVIDTHDFFEYDHVLRMVYHTQDLGNLSGIQVISRNTYDELGQLIEKGVGGEVLDNDRWQNISYRYNIRGWLTDINDIYQLMGGVGLIPPAAHDDLFSFKIFYDQNNVGTSNEPLYNGNINQTFWKTGSDNNIRGYNYTYDKLNRLRNANFVIGSNPSNAYREALTYDVNDFRIKDFEKVFYEGTERSSIKELFRTTGDSNPIPNAIDMDILTYQYQTDSNLLVNVTDDAGSDDSNGFLDWNKHLNTGNSDYEYDQNGNLILDRNKGIQSITYNHLNLPVRISFELGRSIQYAYNAAGQKVTKTVENNSTYELIDYLDGFQYAGNILQYFPTPEGYVNVTAKVQDNTPLAYLFNYVYNYTDHLGNIRLSYTKDPDTGKLKILDENHYYPFGLKHQEYVPAGRLNFYLDKVNGERTRLKVAITDEYKYKYNGKEWQDELGLNFYDYGARNYDPAIGRWMNMDPLAEMYRRWSPYNYAVNNPVVFTDPDGMSVQTDFYNLKGRRVKQVDDGKTDKKMVLTNSKDSKEVDKAIESGYVMNQITEGDIDKMDGIYAFAGSDKTGTEQGFMFGQNGESSSVITGEKSGKISSSEWEVAKKELKNNGDSPASDAHLHPLKYDESGNVVGVGAPRPSGPADGEDNDLEGEKKNGYTQPSMILGFSQEPKQLKPGQVVGKKEYNYVQKVGFYDKNGVVNDSKGKPLIINYSTFKAAVQKINKQ